MRLLLQLPFYLYTYIHYLYYIYTLFILYIYYYIPARYILFLMRLLLRLPVIACVCVCVCVCVCLCVRVWWCVLERARARACVRAPHTHLAQEPVLDVHRHAYHGVPARPL